MKVVETGNARNQKAEPPGTKPKRLRGIYRKDIKNRRLPFVLGWSDGGVVRWQSFASVSEREEAAEKLGENREEHGREMMSFDPREWRRWLEFKAAIGDKDPLEILREWRLLVSAKNGSTTAITVKKAIAEYMDFRKAGSLSEDTLRHFSKHLEERFAGDHGTMELRDVTHETITAWLDRLSVSRGKRKGKAVEPVTRRHHRKDLNTFMEYAVRTRGWLARNPCEAVAVPSVPEEDVQLLTVEEGRRLFEKNAGKRVCGRLALEAFGFLRASSAGRVQLEHLNFRERGIRMPGAAHKSGKAKFRQGHPANLWTWLKAAPDETWTMQPWEYRNEKQIAFGVAGIGESGNRLRKTCLSAHLAVFRNPPLTSYLAQHRHTSTTDIYQGVMTAKDGKAWFGIVP